MKREDMKEIFKEYVDNGGDFSPMNTEPCRRYLEEQIGEYVDSEDVLWLFYHTR